jgi:hypothetical protein
MARQVLLPGLAMVALTYAVALRLMYTRLGTMRRERIHPQSVATSAQMAAKVPDTRAADNLRNLFEMPVLFYFALATAAIAGLADATVIGLAWAYVGFRVLHSLIHCGYNKVMHRFWAFQASTLCLLALWIVLGHGLLNG